MTNEEKIEYDVWEKEHNEMLEKWFNEKLPTMPYYTPTKEQIYVGMECEKRVIDNDYFSYEICASGYVCIIFGLTPNEELREHCQHIWKWKQHIITQEEYDAYMKWTGDYKTSEGMWLEGDIRIKK